LKGGRGKASSFLHNRQYLKDLFVFFVALAAHMSAPAPIPLAVLVPPINFAMIQSGMYRSGFPVDTNFPFISRLRLHTILNLASEEYSRDTIAFLERNNISYEHALPLSRSVPPSNTHSQLRPHQSHRKQVC
jgi:hypothetical protein